MTRRRYVGLDPAHEDAEPIVLYLDDPDGPETFEEALDAFVASCRDLWEVMAVPVAEKAAVKLQAGVDTWRDWWKPMDLSGPWTKGWTREETVLAYIRRMLEETFRRAFNGPATPAPMRGLTPHLVIRDEVASFLPPPGGYGIIRTGLTPDQMARHRAEIPFPQAETNRAFQDATSGDWMVDDGEDEVPESPWDAQLRGMRDRIDEDLGIEEGEDEDSPWGWP